MMNNISQIEPNQDVQYQETLIITGDEEGAVADNSAPADYEETVFQSHDAMDADAEYDPAVSLYINGDPDADGNLTGRIRNKYRVKEKLISGGMGSILKVQDMNLRRTSAMKVILPKHKKDQGTIHDFVTEAVITGLLEHPNIIPVHELGSSPETGIYFTMKLAQGEPLNDIISKIKHQNPLYLDRYDIFYLLSIFRKVCDAVSFAHSKDIIHMDIKPHNIMVGMHGEVLLMDWGLAEFTGDPEEETDPERRDILKSLIKRRSMEKEKIKGTPAYMPPEMIDPDAGGVDKQSDIFLLGATLYHMFTLEPPYTGKDLYEILSKVEARKLVPPELRSPDKEIPEELCRIMVRAMAKKKGDRYPTAEAMARDIDDLIAGRWSRHEKKTFAKGELLMREGEQGKEAYFITKGKVEVYTATDGRKVVFGTLTRGAIVGEMALITSEKRSASVMAVEETEVTVLTQHVLSQNLKKLPPYIEKIVSTITRRLHEANARIHPNLTQNCTYIVLKQLRFLFKDTTVNRVKSAARLPARFVIEDIAQSLGLPHKTVRDVLQKAAGLNLIGVKDGHIHIPDIYELNEFTNLLK